MLVELRDMRWVIAASRYASLRQAAYALKIRQSTLSRRLRELECRLDARLFERTRGGTRLTVAGEEFLEAAERIVREVDATFARFKTRGGIDGGGLVLGLSMASSAGNLSATLTEYCRRQSDVVIRSVDGPRRRLFAELASGAVDIVLSAANYDGWTEKSLPLWSERVVVALPRMHQLASKSVLYWMDLVEERILVNRRDPGSDFEAMLRERLHGQQDCVLISHEVCLDRLLGFVAAGCGVTLVTEGATGVNSTNIVYRELRGDGGAVRIHFAAYWKATNTNPALGSLLSLLQERHPDFSVPSPQVEAVAPVLPSQKLDPLP